jgi:FtsP/CotA-like multicopper oxidase with cupredoxin domain
MLHADWWHDHASGNHADGLAGLFIIDAEEGTPVCTDDAELMKS